MDKWAGLVALVTGASSGIGRAIALKLADHGMQVAALARREDRLQQLVSLNNGKGQIKPYKCDVTDDNSLINTLSQIENTMGPIRVLVNNAGISPKINFMEFDIKTWRKIFDVNLFPMFVCIRELINSIQNRNSHELTHIINMNSISGQYIVPIPDVAIYTCAKQSINLLNRTLIKQIALEKLNIRITSLFPGICESEILDSENKKFDYSKKPHLSADDVAEAALAVLCTRENVIVSEMVIKPKGETI